MKIAIYSRVSTQEQHPENQIISLTKYAQARGFEIYSTYVDRASGSKDTRPSLNGLMTDAREKRFDGVLVWKLERLGRSLQHLIQIIS